jgi:hypothetical protein
VKGDNEMVGRPRGGSWCMMVMAGKNAVRTYPEVKVNGPQSCEVGHGCGLAK